MPPRKQPTEAQKSAKTKAAAPPGSKPTGKVQKPKNDTTSATLTRAVAQPAAKAKQPAPKAATQARSPSNSVLFGLLADIRGGDEPASATVKGAPSAAPKPTTKAPSDIAPKVPSKAAPQASPTHRSTTSSTPSLSRSSPPALSAGGSQAVTATPVHLTHSASFSETPSARPWPARSEEGTRRHNTTRPVPKPYSDDDGPFDYGSAGANHAIHKPRIPTPPPGTIHPLPPRPTLADGVCVDGHAPVSPVRRPSKPAKSSPATKSPAEVSYEADAIVARDLPQAALKAKQQLASKTPAPRRQYADIYKPGLQEAMRVWNRHDYSDWSIARLKLEADRRGIVYEHPNDFDYLIDILMVNDNKFFEAQDEYRSFSVNKLLVEAGLLQIDIDRERKWDRYPLCHTIISKLARNAVASHNGLLRAEKVVARQAEEKRLAAEAELKDKKRVDSNSQRSGSGSSTRGIELSSSPLSSPPDSDDGKGLTDCGKSETPSGGLEQEQPKSLKRASPAGAFGDEGSPKKVKIAEVKSASRVKKGHRPRRSSQSLADNEEVKVSRKKSGEHDSTQAAVQADDASPPEDTISVDTSKKLNRGESHDKKDEEVTDKPASKKLNTRAKGKATAKNTPPVIVSAAERVMGQSYTPLSNGLFQLKQSARMARTRPKAKEPSPGAGAIDSSKFIF